MRYAKTIPSILIGATLACGGGSDAGSASRGAAAASTRATSAADLPDPCGLVTDGEVSDLLWRGMEANQRDAMKARNAHAMRDDGTIWLPPRGGASSRPSS